MKATLHKLEGNNVRVNIQLGAEDVDEALERAYRKVVRDVRIPGFRKGKAPRPILERYIGKGVLYEEAIEDLVPRAYADAVEELELEPIDTPEIDIVKFEEGDGFEFNAKVQVMPEVVLGNYRDVRLEYEVPTVTEEAVDEELESLRRSRSQLVAVEDDDAELQEGQYAVIDFEGYVEGEPIENARAEEYLLEVGSGSLIEGFEEQLVGMKPGEERNITVTFPEEYGVEELAGKEAEFRVRLHEIKERVLPELDQEFLQELGSYNTVEQLRSELREQLEANAEREAERDYRNKVVAAVVDRAQVEIPEILIERRIDGLIQELRNQFRRQNYSLDDYLAQTAQSMEELRQEFRERAEREVRTDLVLESVAETEGMEADPEDLEAEVQAMGRLYGQPADAFRSFMLSGDNARQLRHNIKLQKTIEFLAAIAQGVLPEEARNQAGESYRERLERSFPVSTRAKEESLTLAEETTVEKDPAAVSPEPASGASEDPMPEEAEKGEQVSGN